MVHKTPGHRFFTATPEPLRDTDAKELKIMFAEYGIRPKGQKAMAYAMHTVLITNTMGGEFFLTTVKDRERERLTRSEVKDFAMDYLCKIGGWTL